MTGRRWVVVVASAWAVAGCSTSTAPEDPPHKAPEPPPPPLTCGRALSAEEQALPTEEQEARAAYDCAPIALGGRVVDPSGAPVPHAKVSAHDRAQSTGDDGSFLLEGLARQNTFVRIEAEGFRPVTLPLWLRRGLDEEEARLHDVALVPAQPDRARLMFTGDFALGRRFLDPSGKAPLDRLPPDHPDALIQVSNPEPGARAVVGYISPLTREADLTAVNLESPVTEDPRTPHQTKDFAFFTLPRSLVALKDLGAGYVSLGNNHVYDYLEAGLADTLRHLDDAGIAHSGAGLDADAAFRPWESVIAGTPFSFVSACSIAGDAHDEDYVASSAKGGAADLRDDARMSAALGDARRGGRVPVALLHTGLEYSDAPGSYAHGRAQWAIEQGAEVVIAHHPHRLQGVARHEGKLIFSSLGNFAFDQDRLETMIGGLAEVEVKGGAVDRAALIPVYLEDYRPRPIAGALASRALREVSERSVPHGAWLVPHNGRGLVLPPGATPSFAERSVTVDVEVGARGWEVVDLRGLLQNGEWLARADASGGAVRLRAGRDLLLHGDFEDYDVDDAHGEAARWYLPDGLGHPCLAGARRGAGALCLSQLAQTKVTANLRNRLRVMGDAANPPNEALTVVGALRGRGAGAVDVHARFYASDGDAEFGSQTLVTHPGGDFDWTPFVADVQMPQDPAGGNTSNSARALRLFLGQRPGPDAAGQVAFDDLAVVTWDGPESAALHFTAPQPRDFLRVVGPPGRHTLTLVLQRPSAAAAR